MNVHRDRANVTNRRQVRKRERPSEKEKEIDRLQRDP